MALVVKVNEKNVGAILKGVADARLEADLQRRGDAIASHACALAGLPEGSFVTVIDRGATRLRCTVITATAEAMVAEATGRVLTRALDAGRA